VSQNSSGYKPQYRSHVGDDFLATHQANAEGEFALIGKYFDASSHVPAGTNKIRQLSFCDSQRFSGSSSSSPDAKPTESEFFPDRMFDVRKAKVLEFLGSVLEKVRMARRMVPDYRDSPEKLVSNFQNMKILCAASEGSLRVLSNFLEKSPSVNIRSEPTLKKLSEENEELLYVLSNFLKKSPGFESASEIQTLLKLYEDQQRRVETLMLPAKEPPEEVPKSLESPNHGNSANLSGAYERLASPPAPTTPESTVDNSQKQSLPSPNLHSKKAEELKHGQKLSEDRGVLGKDNGKKIPENSELTIAKAKFSKTLEEALAKMEKATKIEITETSSMSKLRKKMQLYAESGKLLDGLLKDRTAWQIRKNQPGLSSVVEVLHIISMMGQEKTKIGISLKRAISGDEKAESSLHAEGKQLVSLLEEYMLAKDTTGVKFSVTTDEITNFSAWCHCEFNANDFYGYDDLLSHISSDEEACVRFLRSTPLG
jgi:hypothetical protein